MSKKYDLRVQATADRLYTAEVIRRRTARGTAVERSKTGFATHNEAKKWAEQALAAYLAQRERSKTVTKNARTAQRAFEAELPSMSRQDLAKIVMAGHHRHRARAHEWLRFDTEQMWSEYVDNLMRRHGKSQNNAVVAANHTIGQNWSERLAKALDGSLDAVDDVLRENAVARAQKLVATVLESQHQASVKAHRILTCVRKLPGSKILTLALDEAQMFDVSDDGLVGHAPHHEALLLYALDQGLARHDGATPGVLMVRQFIPDSAQPFIAPNGRTIMMPWKSIYGILLYNQDWHTLNAEDVESACACQPDGSARTEPFVLYMDASTWLPLDSTLLDPDE